MAKTEFGQQEQPAQAAGGALCGQAQEAEGRRRRSDEAAPKCVLRRGSSWRSCRATRRRRASATAASSRARARLLPQARVCRNMLRELASQGLIPGMVKSSW